MRAAALEQKFSLACCALGTVLAFWLSAFLVQRDGLPWASGVARSTILREESQKAGTHLALQSELPELNLFPPAQPSPLRTCALICSHRREEGVAHPHLPRFPRRSALRCSLPFRRGPPAHFAFTHFTAAGPGFVCATPYTGLRVSERACLCVYCTPYMCMLLFVACPLHPV